MKSTSKWKIWHGTLRAQIIPHPQRGCRRKNTRNARSWNQICWMSDIKMKWNWMSAIYLETHPKGVRYSSGAIVCVPEFNKLSTFPHFKLKGNGLTILIFHCASLEPRRRMTHKMWNFSANKSERCGATLKMETKK